MRKPHFIQIVDNAQHPRRHVLNLGSLADEVEMGGSVEQNSLDLLFTEARERGYLARFTLSSGAEITLFIQSAGSGWVSGIRDNVGQTGAIVLVRSILWVEGLGGISGDVPNTLMLRPRRDVLLSLVLTNLLRQKRDVILHSGHHRLRGVLSGVGSDFLVICSSAGAERFFPFLSVDWVEAL